jgi:S-(hydroxymethyl)glutathione dehydrogenase / alcohol dehydrogenase
VTANTTAAVLVAQHEPLVVDEVELPEMLRFGQVLVRLAFSGICGSQLGEIDGVKGPDSYLPHLLGHEGSGVVEDVGEGVTTVAAGDRVVLHWRPGAGLRGEPPRYRWRGQGLNAGWVTTFNERAVVSEDRVTRLPEGFPLDLAALLGCAVTTGFGVIANDAGVVPGESVVVLGAGGIGLSIVQAAALTSAHPIVAVDLHESRLALARQLGATHTIDASATNTESAVSGLLGAGGADVCIDNTGNPRVIEAAVRLTGPRGRTVLVGVPAAGQDVSLHTLQFHFGKRLTGSHGGEAQPATDIPRLAKLFDAGRLELQPLITEVVGLELVNEAIARMRNGELAGRCLLELSGER